MKEDETIVSMGAESCQNGRNGESQSPETENLEHGKALRRERAAQ